MPPAAPLQDLTGVLQPSQLGRMIEECGRRCFVESVEIRHLLGGCVPRPHSTAWASLVSAASVAPLTYAAASSLSTSSVSRPTIRNDPIRSPVCPPEARGQKLKRP